MTFNELIRLLQDHGYRLIREKGSVRYYAYAKEGSDQVIRIDYHGSKEVPTGTCRHILKEAGIPRN